MNQKIRYWLLPVLVFALLLLFLGTEASIFNPKKFDSGFLWLLSFCLCLFLPFYLLFLLSCVNGFKLFSMPKPERGLSFTAAFVAMYMIPVVFVVAIVVASEFNEYKLLSFSLLFSIALSLVALIVLCILGIRPPRGKCLFMCFLPVLILALIGTLILLVAVLGFNFDLSTFGDNTPAQPTFGLKSNRIFDYLFISS